MSKRRKAQEKPIHPSGLEVANLEIDTPPDLKQRCQSQPALALTPKSGMAGPLFYHLVLIQPLGGHEPAQLLEHLADAALYGIAASSPVGSRPATLSL